MLAKKGRFALGGTGGRRGWQEGIPGMGNGGGLNPVQSEISNGSAPPILTLGHGPGGLTWAAWICVNQLAAIDLSSPIGQASVLHGVKGQIPLS